METDVEAKSALISKLEVYNMHRRSLIAFSCPATPRAYA